MKPLFTTLALFLLIIQQGCLIKEKCYRDEDCPYPRICNPDSGSCIYQCTVNEDCDERFYCENHRCLPEETENIECPDEMVPVADSFCIDRYEASRPDATDLFAGIDGSFARSVQCVIPWRIGGNADAAEAACADSGKRLCTPMEWELACKGTDAAVYGYGNDYEPETCNGLDTFGIEHFHVTPTGSLAACTNEWGVYDMNGNLWEYVAGGSPQMVRGGAYNCIDSKTLHRCDYVPGNWTPSALGFRCCLTPPPAGDNGERVEADDAIAGD